jgi:probable addiction module antidote protein
MAIRTKAFDAAKYFTSPEDQAELIADALETGEPGYIVDAIGVVAKARGMTDIANEIGVSRTSLYAALKEGGNPGFGTVIKVMRSLGIQLTAKVAADAKEPEPAP